MFLLNASINLESHLFYRFTIQNVSIKSEIDLASAFANHSFTIYYVCFCKLQ